MPHDRSSDGSGARLPSAAAAPAPGRPQRDHAYYLDCADYLRLDGIERGRARLLGDLIARGLRAVAGVIGTRLIAPYRRRRERRDAIRALMRLGDHHLADIGLTRSDIPAAVDGAFVQSPTLYRATLSWADEVGAGSRRRTPSAGSWRRSRRSRAGTRARRAHARRVVGALGSAVADIRRRRAGAEETDGVG